MYFSTNSMPKFALIRREMRKWRICAKVCTAARIKFPPLFSPTLRCYNLRANCLFVMKLSIYFNRAQNEQPVKSIRKIGRTIPVPNANDYTETMVHSWFTSLVMAPSRLSVLDGRNYLTNETRFSQIHTSLRTPSGRVIIENSSFKIRKIDR